MALVAGSVWLVFYSSYVTVESAQVTGNTSVATARIERAADVPTGTPLARVDLDAIRQRVEAIPAVRRASISRSWPHRVHVAVTERTPIAVVNRGNGLEALDEQGVTFGSFAKRPRGLPLVRTQPDTPTEAMAEGGKVIASLPSTIAGRVDTIEVDSVDQISLVLRNGRRVVWGSAEDSAQKAEVLAVLLRRPEPGHRRHRPGPPHHPLARNSPCLRRNSRRAPRVATVRCPVAPNLFSPPQVDITLTLYFKVNVLEARGFPDSSIQVAHPRVVRQPAGWRASERHPPWQHPRTTWP